jgi:outer membrane lipoprotein-sorting protein
MESRKFLIILFFLAGLILKVPAGAENSDQTLNIRDLLLDIEKKVSKFKNLQTEFTQEKDLSIFKNKIILKGRIYIQKPHKVAWHVDEPIRYSVLITRELIRQWDEETDQIQEIPLSANPVFSIVTEQLTAWFSGHYVDLLEDYEIRINSRHPLKMEFVPKETSGMQKIIKTIIVTFRDDERYLKKIKFLEMNGDSTTITFRNTILDIPLDENVFRIGPVKKHGT